MDYDAIIVHFGEMWLKGRNRDDFINQLVVNIKSSLKDLNVDRIENKRDRLMVYAERSDYPKILERLKSMPGISWFAPVYITKPAIGEMLKKAEAANKIGNKKNLAVKIEVSRSYKEHKFNSNDVITELLKQSREKKIKFELDKNSDKKIYINIHKESAFVYTERIKGIGGLPVGSSGSAVILLSGGIDSPVAAFYAMKRGLSPIYLHFHTFPDSKKALSSKIPKMIAALSGYSDNSKTYYSVSHIFQSYALKVPQKYELVLFKNFIYRIAERVAKTENAKVIITGESIGQVASQTIENLSAAQSGIKMLILRPLAGMDKEEIIKKAQEIGTYALSVEKYRDVCSIKIKNPATKLNSAVIKRIYKDYQIGEAVEKTYSQILKV